MSRTIVDDGLCFQANFRIADLSPESLTAKIIVLLLLQCMHSIVYWFKGYYLSTIIIFYEYYMTTWCGRKKNHFYSDYDKINNEEIKKIKQTNSADISKKIKLKKAK